MQKTLSFLHSGSIGDVWACLPALREHHRKTGNGVILYLVNGQKAFYYENALHPTTDPNTGEMVMLNESMINMMIPLLKAQPFIHDAKIWSNQPYQIDLNRIRETFVNMPNGCISRWYFYIIPDTACDLSEVWLTAPDSDKDLAKDKIIITRTERYLNPHINYKFLKDYEEQISFVGTELEYLIFKTRYNLNIERLIVNDFLELAQALKQCKFHISNQTQAFQLSQGLKIPRILETCKFAPNVIPYGKDAFDFYAQESLEYYVATLLGEEMKMPLSPTGFPLPPVIKIPS